MNSKDVITNKYNLLLGDCLERMKEIPDRSVDLILTESHEFCVVPKGKRSEEPHV